MNTENIYKCLSDMERVRILNLLSTGSLCVCHLQAVLGQRQVKISKQLLYMKKLGVVESAREANWVVYQLAQPVSPVLLENLRLLGADASVATVLKEDMDKRRDIILARVASNELDAPEPIRKQCCWKIFPACEKNKQEK